MVPGMFSGGLSVEGSEAEDPLENRVLTPGPAPRQEEVAAKAKRLTEQLRFRMKEAMAQRGGSEAFLHWLRSDGGKRP
jgi:hypothetical protein